MVDWGYVQGGPISSYGMGADCDESSHFDGPESGSYGGHRHKVTRCRYCKSDRVEWDSWYEPSPNGGIKRWRLIDKGVGTLHKCDEYHAAKARRQLESEGRDAAAT